MENPETEIIPIIHALTTTPPSTQQATLEQYFTPNASFTHPFCRTGSFLSIVDLVNALPLVSSHNKTGSTRESTSGRVGGIDSRWLILQIYRWYKILSPRIDIFVDSVAWDQSAPTRGRPHVSHNRPVDAAAVRNLNADAGLLYVSIRQKLRIWPAIPFGYEADVRLVTVLSLTTASADPKHSPSADHGSSKRYYIAHQEDLYQTSDWIKFIIPWGLGAFLVIVWQLFATLNCVIGALLLGPFTSTLERLIGGDAENERGQNKRVKSG